MSAPPICQQPLLGQESGFSNYTQGLGCLIGLDRVIIDKAFEYSDMFIFDPAIDKYFIRNNQEQDILFAVQTSLRRCGDSTVPFEMKISDRFKSEVVNIKRPLQFDGCCCKSYAQKLLMYTPNDELLGSFGREANYLYRKFYIRNSNEETVFLLQQDGFKTVKINSFDGNIELGKIERQWTGCKKECCIPTLANKYEVTFPADLEVRCKALIICAAFAYNVGFTRKLRWAT